jgi:hypothetical protein
MNWIILAIIIGASVISWVFRKIQEEAERRGRRDAQVRRELERLRTGREPGAEVESVDQMQRTQELQARRQAQLQELRRRQQERSRVQQTQVRTVEARIGPGATATPPTAPGAGTATGGTRQPPLVWVPGSSGPTVPQRSPTTGRKTTAAPPPATRPRQTAGPRPQAGTRPQPTARVEPMARAPRKSIFQTPPAPPPPPPPPPPVVPAREVYARTAARPAAPGSFTPKSSADWRRAIIMHEILSPSKAMRPAEDDRPPELPR